MKIGSGYPRHSLYRRRGHRTEWRMGMLDWKNATNEDALAAWDAGDSVWSVELGGLGPGYEQCIQLMGFETLRAMLANPPADWAAFTDDKDAWKAYREMIEALPEVKAAIAALQPSGAQFGAAMNIASVFARKGYAAGLAMAESDRHIQVRKSFPSLNGTMTAPTAAEDARTA
jgi:hypothetical protein